MKTQHSTSIERVFMQMCCIETGYMYVGFKTFYPEQDIGMDFSEEYNMAKKLLNEKTNGYN
jgi:hypothetical protein